MIEAVIFEPRKGIFQMETKAAAGVHTLNADVEAIFEEVFKTHFKGLHSYACTIVRDESTAEEMVQNVFYKLWEKREQIKVEQSIASYLYRAVYNESLNFIRHSKVKYAYQADAVRTMSEAGNTSTNAETRELEQKIQVALSELPEQCRTIFQMSRFEDLKYREIADKLGLSVKTVENQMGKALKVLRHKLAEYLPVLWLLFINLKNWMV